METQMKIITAFSVLALMAPLGCSKKDEGKSEATEAAKPAPNTSGDNTATKVGLETGGKALGGEPVKLSGLKFGGSGYDGEFNEALDSWKFEKWEPQSDGTNSNVVTIYVDGWSSEWPADMDAFATKLGEANFLDFGSKWPKIDKKEAFDGGWVITGEWSDEEDTEQAFAVQLTKARILCRGTVKKEAADAAKSVAEGVAACKAATIP